MSYKKQELVDKEFDEKFPLIKQTGHEEVEGTFFHEEDRAAVKEFIANQRKKDLESVKQLILRRTEIPKGARNPTRDIVVILGEELCDLLDRAFELQSLNK